MEKKTYKTIAVSPTVHRAIAIHAARVGESMGEFVSRLALEAIAAEDAAAFRQPEVNP